MRASQHVQVNIDLARVTQAASEIVRQTNVSVLAVIKSDAYGLGAAEVVDAIEDLVAGYCVFSPEEAISIDLNRRTGKKVIALSPPTDLDPTAWLSVHVRPSVTTVEQAIALRRARPLLAVDTGMQRFNCPADQVDPVLQTGVIDEAFTHATRLEQVTQLKDLSGGRVAKLHAAGSSLLHEPEARLDAVRPGIALYRDAVRVSTTLVEARNSRGPIGYSGFISTTGRHGVIRAGYFNGLRRGVCLINGERRAICEVGMQSAFVEIGPNDQVGDEVVLLGDGLSPEEVASAAGCGPHEVLVRACAMGERHWR